MPDFMTSVRKGVPDGLKRCTEAASRSLGAQITNLNGRLIWPLAAGQALASKVSDVNAGLILFISLMIEEAHVADEFYTNLLDRSFGGIHPCEFQAFHSINSIES